MNTKPNQSNSTKNGDSNASVAEITFMDLAVLGAKSEGLTPEDLDNASGEELWDFIEIAEGVIYRAGLVSLFRVAFHPKEELHPWTAQEEAEHNEQEPLPCHRDEM